MMLLGVLAQLSLATWATSVDMNQAREAAVAFMQQKQAVLRSSGATTASTLQTAANTGYYYVFNVGDNNGFVIVSGDDRTTPVLGYATEGHFDATRVPVNMQEMLDNYNAQLKALATMNDVEAATRLAAPRRATTVNTRNSIAPMITTKWDQATPYWNHCPEFMHVVDGDTIGELAYTGCVATAMAQIMKHYNWPAQCTQTIPSYNVRYYDTYVEDYGYFDTDPLEPRAFDWDHMKDSYTGAEDEVYTEAVSWLMLYVGCAAQMQYGMSASSTSDPYIPKAFQNYFDYDAQLVYRSDYDQPTWEEMIYQELAAGRPMVYNGRAGSGGGHSFVCDGYEYGDYFHINWGWGGMGNGYFQLAILNPSASGIGGSSSAEGYNMKQNIVYNIQPGGSAPGDDDELEPALTVTAFSGPSAWDRSKVSDPFKIHKSKIVKVSYSDHENSGKKFKTALALLNPADGTFSLVENSADNIYMTVTTSALGYTHQFGSGITSTASNVIKFGTNMTGTYHMVGVYQVEGSSEWKLMKESDRYYMEVTMTSTEANANYHPTINLAVTNWEFTGGERVGVKEQVHVTLKNNSVDRFYGDLYLDFGGQQIDEVSQYTTVVTGEVLPGEENVITFNVTPTSSGTKTVRIMRQSGYDYATIGQTTVNIAQSAEAEELNLSVVIQAENATTQPSGSNTYGEIYDSHARFSATITNNSNGEYNKYVLAPLFIVKKNPDGSVAGGSMVTYKQSTLSLAAGESKTLYFDFDDLAYGSTYAMNIYARNYVPDSQEGTHVENIVEPGHSVYYDIKPGIITWTAQGVRNGYQPVEGFQIAADVAAVNLEGLTLSNIVPNSNPNTLYFVGENETAPSSLAGKNIVKGNTATSIALKDGYPYFTPMSFTAQAISYERTFDKARQDGVAENWSTIVLPFTPTSVSNSNLWIERFAQEVDGVVTFSEVSSIDANVPYIIAAKQAAVGTPITWSAADVLIKAEPIAYTSGQAYMMAGTFVGETVENAYTVNAAGSLAQWAQAGKTVEPFRAYFKEIAALENHTDIALPGEATTPSYLPGDVNGDGDVNVMDITALIDVIMNDITDNPRADVNEDGHIDVMDITALIDIIMNM